MYPPNVPRYRYRKSGQILRNLYLGTFGGVHLHFLSHAANPPRILLSLLVYTTLQITMPGTPTSLPPRRSPRSKTLRTPTITRNESDAEDNSQKKEKKLKKDEGKKISNNKNTADIPTKLPPPRRSPRSNTLKDDSSESEDAEDNSNNNKLKDKKNRNNKRRCSDKNSNMEARKRNKAAAGSGKRSGKTPNYSEEEDYLIAVSFVYVTVDPIRGVGQKSATFWTRVHEKFCLLQQQELANVGVHTYIRTRDSIEQRWKKRISKSVQLWNKYYRQLKGTQKSGWNEDKYIEEASSLYKDDTGETFRFAKCVPVLHKLPKYDPMVLPPSAPAADDSPPYNNYTGSDEEGEVVVRPEATSSKKRAALVNNRAPPQGSNMDRPMGMKKAKLLKKLEDTGVLSSTTTGMFSDSVSGSRNNEEESVIADMSSATKELVSVLKAATSLKQDEARMKKHDKWMKMASIYASCGQHDLALATMKKIEDDDDQLAASEAASKETACDDNSDDAASKAARKETACDDNSDDAMESVSEVDVESIEIQESVADVEDVESIETARASARTVCIECKQTPTTHKCRRCRQFVCDFCCSEKRGLQMIWWCGTCFGDESLTNQKQIREGKYESDDE